MKKTRRILVDMGNKQTTGKKTTAAKSTTKAGKTSSRAVVKRTTKPKPAPKTAKSGKTAKPAKTVKAKATSTKTTKPRKTSTKSTNTVGTNTDPEEAKTIVTHLDLDVLNEIKTEKIYEELVDNSMELDFVHDIDRIDVVKGISFSQICYLNSCIKLKVNKAEHVQISKPRTDKLIFY